MTASANRGEALLEVSHMRNEELEALFEVHAGVPGHLVVGKVEGGQRLIERVGIGLSSVHRVQSTGTFDRGGAS